MRGVKISWEKWQGQSVAKSAKGEGQREKETYAERWELEPDNEDALESEVPWDVVEEHGEGDRLEEVEEAEHSPICEPLNVIVCLRALNRLEREVGGETPSNEV